MPYVVEVDQSIKVEDPGDIFLAFSDGISYAIQIPFSVKQKGFQALRNQGKPKKRAKLLLFAACVFLFLEGQEALTDIIRRRIIEQRRAELAKDIQEAQEEFKAGNAHPVTPDELIAGILS